MRGVLLPSFVEVEVFVLNRSKRVEAPNLVVGDFLGDGQKAGWSRLPLSKRDPEPDFQSAGGRRVPDFLFQSPKVLSRIADSLINAE